jgi:hypothetical protein
MKSLRARCSQLDPSLPSFICFHFTYLFCYIIKDENLKRPNKEETGDIK